MITPSKERSEEECGTRVEVNSNSDILELFLNTDRGALDSSTVYPRMLTRSSRVSPDSGKETVIHVHAYSIKCRPG
jgi:hypothetical protein